MTKRRPMRYGERGSPQPTMDQPDRNNDNDSASNAPASIPSVEHALRDYEMQLMLLEEQNKKRREQRGAVAREEPTLANAIVDTSVASAWLSRAAKPHKSDPTKSSITETLECSYTPFSQVPAPSMSGWYDGIAWSREFSGQGSWKTDAPACHPQKAEPDRLKYYLDQLTWLERRNMNRLEKARACPTDYKHGSLSDERQEGRGGKDPYANIP